MIRRSILAACLALGAGAAQAQEAPDIAGPWLTEKGKVGVELYPCGSLLCGRIVWLAKPRWSEGTLKRDERNPDPALRDRHWCGIEVITGLRKEGGDWEDGRFYYPKDGRSYDIAIEPQGDGTLEVRAYRGIRLLGKTETWTRPDEPLPGCEPEA